MAEQSASASKPRPAKGGGKGGAKSGAGAKGGAGGGGLGPGLLWRVRPEQASDQEAVEAILDRAFGPKRQTARVSYRLREGLAPIAALSLAAAGPDKRVLGTIRAWPLAAGEARLLLLGPLAVEPALKGQGIGRTLLAECLARARREGWPGGVLVGDLDYYRSFGFTRASERGLFLPPQLARAEGVAPESADPRRFLAVELSLGGLRGIAGEVAPAPPAARSSSER